MSRIPLLLLSIMAASACSQPPAPPEPMPGPTSCANEHELDELGPDECALKAGALELNTSVFRTIAFQTDEDWYLVPATELAMYDLSTSASYRNDPPCADCAVHLALIDGEGTVLAEGETLLIAPVRSGPLYLRVTSGVVGQPRPLFYFLSVEARAKDDHPNDFEPAPAPLDAPTVGGVIDYRGDTDVVQLNLPANRRLQLELAGARVSAKLTVPGFAPHPLSRVTFTLAEPLTARLEVGCADVLNCTNQYPDPLPPWTITLRDLGPDDASDDLFAAQLLTDQASGTCDLPYDHDTFRLAPMLEDHFYFLEVTGTARALVYELNGDGVAAAPMLFRGQPRERKLLIACQVSGPWSVRLVDASTDDVPNTIDSAWPLDLNAAFIGRFEEPRDVDAFSITAVQNHFYSANADVAALGTFIDGFGREIAGPLPLFVRADRSGPMPLLLTRSLLSTPPTQAYRLTVQDLGADEIAEPLGLALPTDGGLLLGAFQAPIDVDRFEFASSADQRVEVRVTSSHGVTARIALIDGGTITRSGAAVVAFSAQPSVTSHFELSPAAGARPGISWVLAAHPVTDDFDDVTPTPITIGTPTFGMLEFADDVDLFSFDVTSAYAPFRVHIAPGCVFVTLISPDGRTQGLWNGNSLFTQQPGRYLLRVVTDRCEQASYGFTVTFP